MKYLSTFLATAALAVALAAPASADAAYSITQGAARLDTADAAEYLYSDNGVSVDATRCRPQGSGGSFAARYGGRYHRWACIWVGTDGDGADVGGAFRITGHSDGTYGYLAVAGGLRWL